MATNKKYDFGEKTTEFYAKVGKEVPVWQTPKYVEAKQKAIETLESDMFKNVLSASDFWILMNGTKSGKMAYTGLIISHNGCLKINDALPAEKRFVPSCMTLDKEGYSGSLVYSYQNDEQGIFEVGEVSAKNCTNAYPYAMALKRCMDRVILKNSKLAYSGIYSDSEAEEFKNEPSEPAKAEKKTEKVATVGTYAGTVRAFFVQYCKENDLDIKKICADYKLNNDTTDERFKEVLNDLGAYSDN